MTTTISTTTISNSQQSSDINDIEQNSCEHQKKTETKKNLRKQLKLRQTENDELHTKLEQKDNEISELNKKLISLNNLINSEQIDDFGGDSSIASTKIFNLSKKNRQLCAELAAVRTRYSKINGNYIKLQKEFEEYKIRNELQNVVMKKDPCCESSSQLESLQDQLNVTKQKLFETLNSNNKLKNDLKLAQKCIQQEIGENFNLSVLASANPTWRGRSQQILALQSKVNELKDKLDAKNGIRNSLSSSSSTSSLSSTSLSRKKSGTSYRSELDELNTQIHELKSIIDEYKKKFSALKTRNKNLTDEVMNYKLKAINLMEQTDNSDNSIQVLNEKLNVQKYMYENKIQNLKKEIEDMKLTKDNLENDKKGLYEDIENLKSMNNLKQQEIENLHQVIQKLEDDLRSMCGDFLFSCRELKKEEYIAILDALETEKRNLIERNEILVKRLNDEREKIENLNDQISKLKIKNARQEAKLKEIQKDQEALQNKKKRSQRINEFSQSLSNVRLPTIVIENSNSCPNVNYTSTSTMIASKLSETYEHLDLRLKLELAEEKISLLDDKIQNLITEKHMDTKLFNEILSNSKNILLNVIRQNQLKQNTIEIGLQTDNNVTEDKLDYVINSQFCNNNNVDQMISEQNDHGDVMNFDIFINYDQNNLQ